MVKVLVVDDSAFMRSAISRMLKSDPEIEVIGQAIDGVDALEKIEQLNPDVITLDIEMPRMDGLQTLAKLMEINPKPVLMISSLTSEGADATLKALELGALDFMPKYQEGSVAFAIAQQELTTKVHTLAKRASFMRLHAKQIARNALMAKSTSSVDRPSAIKPGTRPSRDIIAIAVSTGGPPAVQQVLSRLPAEFPASILIAQHMPASFTGAFAKRLDTLCKIKVKEAQNGDKLDRGVAYVCPGGQHMRIALQGALPYISISSDPEASLYKPSANFLMETAGTIMGSKVIGLTMTGMGNDGVQGTKVLKQKGGYIIAQNEASCVVYGMPKAVVDSNLADEIVALDDITTALEQAIYR